jgi:hypothetical protein
MPACDYVGVVKRPIIAIIAACMWILHSAAVESLCLHFYDFVDDDLRWECAECLTGNFERAIKAATLKLFKIDISYARETSLKIERLAGVGSANLNFCFYAG